MQTLSKLGWVALIILLIGGIDIGIYGISGIFVLQLFFTPLISHLFFILVGICSLYTIYELAFRRNKKSCTQTETHTVNNDQNKGESTEPEQDKP